MLNKVFRSSTSFEVGLTFLFFSFVCAVFFHLSSVPSYATIPEIQGRLTKITNWKSGLGARSRSDTHIYIANLKLSIGECADSINTLRVGDNLKIRYKATPYAIIDGRAYEIIKENDHVCNYEKSFHQASKTQSEFGMGTIACLLIGILSLLYSYIKNEPK